MKTLVPDDLKARMDEAGQAVNWSVIAQQAFREVILNLALRRETATMDDAVERLRASKQSYVETERESGLEVGEEWATEDATYSELLRIAKAVEEARREIDLQTLQDLIDPEHKMDAGDWVRFWEDRGFSGDSEPSDVWVRAFADRAARLFQKARKHVI
jgi:hypothetical protein